MSITTTSGETLLVDGDVQVVDPDTSGSYAKAAVKEHGYSFELFLHPLDRFTPSIAVGFTPGEDWVRMSYAVEHDPGGGDDGYLVEAGGNQPGLSGLVTPPGETQIMLRPSIEPHSFSMLLFNDVLPEETSRSGTLRFAYTLEVTAPPIPGDANLDGSVNLDDFLVVARNFQSDPRFRDSHWVAGDFNGDEFVTFADYVILANNYGRTTEAASFVVVPEPSFKLLSLSVVSSLLSIRRPRSNVISR